VDESSDLVALQPIQSMEKKVKNSSDEMYVLLALNFEARGLARFGTVKDGGQDLLVLTARLAPETISRASVEGMLTDCFRLSRRVDELLGNEPAQAPAEMPPPPPGQAPVDAPAAETVFAQPVPHPLPAEPAAPEPAAQPDPGLDFPPPLVEDPTLAFPPPAAEPAPAAEPVAAPDPAPPAQPEPPPPPQQELPPPNWYADPYQQGRLRYWDGRAWTEHVAN
jgi:hypothetical protein